MSSDLPSYPGDQPAQPSYGQGSYDAPPPAPATRPGRVTAASILTIVLSLLTAVTGVVAIAASGSVADYVRDHPEQLEGVDASQRQDVIDAIDSGVTGFGVLFLVVAAVGVLLGILVLKPRNGARITLTVTAGLTILSAILPSLNLVGLPWLVGGIVVIVLLFTGQSNAWFSRRAA